MTKIISTILLAISLIIVGYVSMVNLSGSNMPEVSNPTVTIQFNTSESKSETILEPDIDTSWVEKYEKEICFAGVSLRNRWGYPGQAKPGTFLQEKNGIYSFRSYEGDSDIHCTIKGSKILMSWSSKFKDDSNRYYTFKKNDDGKNVEVTEFEWGTVTSRVYPVR